LQKRWLQIKFTCAYPALFEKFRHIQIEGSHQVGIGHGRMFGLENLQSRD
jgi:hypothetical protein